jgi:hypothetical protein
MRWKVPFAILPRMKALAQGGQGSKLLATTASNTFCSRISFRCCGNATMQLEFCTHDDSGAKFH